LLFPLPEICATHNILGKILVSQLLKLKGKMRR